MRKAARFIFAIVTTWVSVAVHAAVPAGFDSVTVDTDKTNLTPLIEAATADPDRFAVDILHPASPTQSGEWSVENGNAVWRYAVSVPGAASLSLHATGVSIPDDAVVTLSNGTDVFSITAKSLNASGDLWSRIVHGDTAYLQATMPQGEKGAFALSIMSLQAGYKGFGGSGNVKAYDAYMASSTASSCDINYACAQTTANTLPGRALVGVLINNTEFCSGTLINNLKQDHKPYVLFARHCGTIADPTYDASSVSIAWNAVAPCGQPLFSLYGSDAILSTGATTRMVSAKDALNNTGDAWLIELDSAPPVGSNPYWLGFDATDTVPTGMVYAIHHATELSSQYAESTNPPTKQSFVTNGTLTGPDTGFWSMFWTIGRTAPGASGSGLIDASSNRLIGSLTGGVNTNSCPGDSTPPEATFYRLAMSWAGDGTPAASLKFWLDPNSTGTKVLDGIAGPPSVTVTSPSSATVGQAFTVSWNSSDASSCSASGGTAGDGWTLGAVGTSGSAPVTEASTGLVTYTVACTNSSGNTSQSAVVMVNAAGGSTGGSTGGGATQGSSGGGALSLMTLWPLLVAAWKRKQKRETSIA